MQAAVVEWNEGKSDRAERGMENSHYKTLKPCGTMVVEPKTTKKQSRDGPERSVTRSRLALVIEHQLQHASRPFETERS